MSSITDTAKEASSRIADGAKFASERIADSAKAASDVVSDGARVAGKRVASGYANALDVVLTGMKLLPTVGTALGYLGLQRKRSNVLGNTLSFGAGLAVGAGAGILLAPKSGAETRAALLKFLRGSSVEDVVEKVETVAKDVGEKAEAAAKEVSDKAEAAVKAAADKAQQVHRNGSRSVS